MAKIFISTTGTLNPVVINDLGGRSFAHPTVDLDLSLEFSMSDLMWSVDLQSSLDNGYIILKNEYGINITTISNSFTTSFSATSFSATSIIVDSIISTGQTNFSSLSAVTLSGGTIFSGSTNLYSIFAQIPDQNDITRVQPGINITTGGTANNPIVNLATSPSINGLTLSGTGNANAFSATTLSGGTILSGVTNLYSIFATIPDQNDITRVQPGSNITTGGTENNPTVNLTASPSVNNIAFSGTAIGGTVQAGSVTATSLSAATLSGGTILSAGTNLYNIFLTTADGNDITRVQPGSNITTGGTANNPIISIIASPSLNGLILSGTGNANAFSATTLSGGTIYSGGTDLYSIFATNASIISTYVQPGSNITTGGTATSPIINLIASPSVNNITFSGTAIGGTVQAGAGTFTSLSATTLSGGTILSGSTNLYSIFAIAGSDQTTASNGLTKTGNNITLGGSLTGITTIQNDGNDLIISGGTSSGSFNVYQQGFFGTEYYEIIANPFTGAYLNASDGNGVPVLNSVSVTQLSAKIEHNNSGDSISLDLNAFDSFLFTDDVNNQGARYAANYHANFINRSLVDKLYVDNRILSGSVQSVNGGSNITTGGTAISPIINLTASPSVNNITFSGTAIGGTVQAGVGTFTSLSATTLSGGTILSGSTNLYSIFTTGAHTQVQPGSNITTGGTTALPTVSLVASPSVNNITFSGTATGSALSATTLSGATILSGSTNLYSIFQAQTGVLKQKSGSVTGSTFAGNPKTAAVSFTTAFPDNNYAVTVTGEIDRTWTIESKSSTGFTINANANKQFNSNNVFWIAIQIGESN